MVLVQSGKTGTLRYRELHCFVARGITQENTIRPSFFDRMLKEGVFRMPL
jgi:hypothetical protein